MSCALADPSPPLLELIDGGPSHERSHQQPRGEVGTPASPDAGLAPSPGVSCREIDRCTMACSDQACRDACRLQGSAEAQARWDAFDLCAESAAKGSCSSAAGSVAAWNACIGAACPAQFAACFQASAGGSGTATCLQIIGCASACAKTDSLCLADCVWRGTAAAQSAYFAWTTCSSAAKASQCQADCATGGQTCSACLSYTCPSSAASCKAS